MKKIAFLLLFSLNFINVNAQDEEWFSYPFSNNGNLYTGYADKYGKIVIAPKYGSIGKFKNGLARVFTGPYEFDKRTSKDFYGYINAKGDEVIKPIYKNANDFSEGMAAVAKSDGTVFGFSKWGYVDVTGKEVIPCNFLSAGNFKDGLAIISTTVDGIYYYYFIDKTGKKVLPAANSGYQYYKSARPFHDGLASVQIPDGSSYPKTGFIDKTGKLIIPSIYGFTGDFIEGVTMVYQDGKKGSIDKTGKLIIPLLYETVENAYKGFIKVYDKTKKTALYTTTGKEIVPLGKYEDIWGSFYDGLCAVKLNGKYGWIDETGKMVIQPAFDMPGEFVEGLARVRTSDKKSGYIDKTGKLIIPYQFGIGSYFSEGLASFLFGEFGKGKYGYINKTGKVVLPAIYDSAEGFKNGNARVSIKYVGFMIDKTGKGTKSTDTTLSSYNYGYIYEKYGNIGAAYSYYKTAEKGGNKQASIELKRLGAAGVRAYAETRYKWAIEDYQKKFYPSAIKIFGELANEGNKEAMYFLGHMHAFGYGTPQNYSTAFTWFDKGAKSGSLNASADLGILYANGLGVAKDLAKAKEYLLIAANGNHPKATFDLGAMYFNGNGVPKDMNEARKWISKAASLNYQLARDALIKYAAALK